MSETKHRRRQLLSAYYGGVGDTDGDGPADDPTDLDSTVFDADQHVEQAIREMPLENLLKNHGELVQEIRTLDSDMQMLVYENYNKFISATDTIRNMKDNVEHMETDMTQLLSNMDKISVCSDQINQTLSGRRQKIENLTGIHSLLKKLQFLFELPSRLNKSIELGALQQAAKYYSSTAPILSRHEHLPSLRKIRIEVEATASGLRKALRDRVNGENVSVADATTDVELLLMMGENEEDILDLYLSSRTTRLVTALDQAELVLVKAVETDIWTDGEQNYICMFLDDIHGSVITDFLAVFDNFSRLFLRSTSVATKTKQHAADMWNRATKDITEKYFKLTRAALGVSGALSSDVLAALQSVNTATSLVHETMPDARFRDQSADIAQSTVHNCVKQGFDELQSDMLHITRWLIDREGEAVWRVGDDVAHDALNAIVSKTETLVANLRPFSTDDAVALSSSKAVLVDLVHVFFQKAFLYLDDELRQVDKTSDIQPKALIDLCKLAMEIERNGIDQVIKLLNEHFPTENSELLNAVELTKRFRDTAKQLLAHYVQLHGRLVSLMIRKSMETPNWLIAKEPRDVRMVMELVVQEVKSVQDEATMVFGDMLNQVFSRSESMSSYSHRSHDPRKGFGSTRYGTAVDSNIERLFARKIEIFSAVEFSVVSIVTGVVKVFLKSFLECTRQCTFSRNGYQQVQIDSQYLRECLYGQVESTSALDLLIDETVASAAHRCTDPVSLDANIVESIIRAHREKE